MLCEQSTRSCLDPDKLDTKNELNRYVEKEKKGKKIEEEEAQERAERLGPAGLDPYEVLEEIPPKMREAFETQNTPLLKETFAALPDGERELVYQKVVGSGLWVPSAEDAAAGADAE